MRSTKHTKKASNGSGGKDYKTELKSEEYIDVGGDERRSVDLTFVDGAVLGKGSYGTVRLARRNKVGRAERVSQDWEDEDEELVAVKIFRKSTLKRMKTMERNKETRKVQVKTAMMKVEREIEIMKKLSHPNLVALFDVISPESDMLYMVLEYMPLGEILTYQNDGTFRRKGSTIGMKLVEGHFDEETAALFLVDILHGLAYLHDNHIAHRDIKPENILLSQTPAGIPIAKMSDFGVAHMFENGGLSNSNDKCTEDSALSPSELISKYAKRALSSGRESTSGILTKTEGTWCFWSPEMCEGKGAFSAYSADVWAAGVCLYIFVSGRLPFFSDCPIELMEKIATTEVPMDDLNGSESLLSLCEMILSRDPDDRAGVGECLSHGFLEEARAARMTHFADELLT